MTDFQDKEKEIESTRFKVTGESKSDLAPIDTGDSAVKPVKDEEHNQNVVLYAGFWRRLWAAIADGYLLNLTNQLIGFAFILFSFHMVQELNISITTYAIFIFVLIAPVAIVIGTTFLAFFECSSLRATPGKLMFNMQVMNSNLKPLSFWQALKKQMVYGAFYFLTVLFYLFASFLLAGCDLAKFIDAGWTNTPAAVLTLIFYLAGLIAPFIGKKKQTLVDLISGRVVFLARYREDSLFKCKDPPPILNFKVAGASLIFTAIALASIAFTVTDVSSKVVALMSANPDFHHTHPIMNFEKPEYTYIKQDGSLLTESRFEDADDFCQGLARVKKDGYMGFIDKTGKQAVPLQFETVENFSEGLAAARVQFGAPWGYIDRSGNFAIPKKFTRAFSFNDGLARVVHNSRTGYIDKKGNYVIEPIYMNGGDFENGKALVRTEWKGKTSQTFIDKQGRELFGKSFKEALPFSEGLAAVKPEDSDLWGFIDEDGNMVIAPRFWFAESFSGGVSACALGDKWGIIDRDGKFVIKAKNESAVAVTSPAKISFPYPVGESILAEDKVLTLKYGYISEDGSYAIKPTFDDAEPFIEGIARVGIRKPQKPAEH